MPARILITTSQVLDSVRAVPANVLAATSRVVDFARAVPASIWAATSRVVDSAGGRVYNRNVPGEGAKQEAIPFRKIKFY